MTGHSGTVRRLSGVCGHSGSTWSWPPTEMFRKRRSSMFWTHWVITASWFWTSLGRAITSARARLIDASPSYARKGTSYLMAPIAVFAGARGADL